MKIRTTIAVMAAKITGHVCKLMGRQGVTWAGKIALKICPDILEELSSQVREKIFKKKYLAVVDGKFEQKQGILEDYLYKDERNNMSKVVNKDKKNAKLAKLDYEVLAYNEVKNLSLVRVNLHTGRHHQIRVQLSHAGHSIFGDQKYGTRGQGKQIALWAYELTIQHPITKEEMTFKCFPESNGTWCILRDIEV